MDSCRVDEHRANVANVDAERDRPSAVFGASLAVLNKPFTGEVAERNSAQARLELL